MTTAPTSRRSRRHLSLCLIALLSLTLAGCVTPRSASSVLPGMDDALPDGTPPPIHTGTRQLAQGDLVVELLDPSLAEELWYNRGTRFSPVAAVLSARYKGREFLHNPVDHDPISHNAGLAMEFDLVSPPPGHDEAKIGEAFLKVGVGALRKKNAQYRFMDDFEIIERADTTITYSDNVIHFRQRSPKVNGYKYFLSVKVVVTSSQINVVYYLENTGTKPLVTQQYAHNFFAFSDAPVGPDYIVSFPYDIQPTGTNDAQTVTAREIEFTDTLAKPVNIRVTAPDGYDGSHWVAVEHTGNHQRIYTRTTYPVDYIALHAGPRYVCPEQFISITLQPEETAEWTRVYMFSD